jgi:hypothetical protein
MTIAESAANEERIEALVRAEVRRLSAGTKPSPAEWRRLFDKARAIVREREKEKTPDA